MSSILILLLAAPWWTAIQAKAVAVDPLLQEHRDRIGIEEAKLAQSVAETIRKAQRVVRADPDGAIEALRSLQNRVKDHPDIGSDIREKLVSRLQSALRETTLHHLQVKIDKAKIKVEEAKLELIVETNIAKAKDKYDQHPKEAMQLMRDALLQVFDHPTISEETREALMLRLRAARAALSAPD
jgi:hypothetical protein